jgi:hypothetical protein
MRYYCDYKKKDPEISMDLHILNLSEYEAVFGYTVYMNEKMNEWLYVWIVSH